MTKHRTAARQHKAGSGFKGRKEKLEKQNRGSFPLTAVWIILGFLLIAALMVYLVTR